MNASSLFRIAFPVVAAGLLAAACSSSAKSGSTPPPSTPTTASAVQIVAQGGHLTNSTGRTIYLWSADTGGTSNCTGVCATTWLPLTGTATAGAGVTGAQLTTVQRTDGSMQVVYAGHPLYYFAEDTQAGQTTGQGSDTFGAKWWEVSPAGAAITNPATSPSSSSSMGGSSGGGYGY